MKFFEKLLRKTGIFYFFSLFKGKNKNMSPMMPKEFIQIVLIKEVGEIHEKYPYIAFATMAIGIEFLGKCLNTYEDWNHFGRGIPKADFELAINNLNSFDKYRPLLTSHNFWDSLRNGFSHSFVPKGTLTLSSKGEDPHMKIVSPTQINLRCEDFYTDFKGACEEVIAMTTFASGKMSRPLLSVPDSSSPSSIAHSGGTPTITTTITPPPIP